MRRPFTQLSLDKSIANLKSRKLFGEVKQKLLKDPQKFKSN